MHWFTWAPIPPPTRRVISGQGRQRLKGEKEGFKFYFGIMLAVNGVAEPFAPAHPPAHWQEMQGIFVLHELSGALVANNIS